jgi:hypothetical protein
MTKFNKKKKYIKLDEIFEFGFHKGKTVKEVITSDKTYFDWCKNNIKGFFISKEIQNYTKDYLRLNSEPKEIKIFPDFIFKRSDKNEIERYLNYIPLVNSNLINLSYEFSSDWVTIKNHSNNKKCQLKYNKLYLFSEINERLNIE